MRGGGIGERDKINDDDDDDDDSRKDVGAKRVVASESGKGDWRAFSGELGVKLFDGGFASCLQMSRAD